MAFEEGLGPDLQSQFVPSGAGAQPLPAASLLAALKKTYPGQRFSGLRLPSSPEGTYITQAEGRRSSSMDTRAQWWELVMAPTILANIPPNAPKALDGQKGATVVCAVAVVLVWLIISGHLFVVAGEAGNREVWRLAGAGLLRPSQRGRHLLRRIPAGAGADGHCYSL